MKTSRDDSVEEQRSYHLRMKRRKSLMEKFEKAMIDVGVVEDAQEADDAEVQIIICFLVKINCGASPICSN